MLACNIKISYFLLLFWLCKICELFYFFFIWQNALSKNENLLILHSKYNFLSSVEHK